MAKQSKKVRRSAPRGGLPLRALALTAALALLMCGAGFLSPGQGAQATLPVVIRRVMTSNPSVCYSVDGSYYDWIELENTSDEAVNLAGWKITDSGDLRDACVLGDRTLEAGQSMIVYCDRAPEGYAGGEIFTGFKLSGDGELLLLADPAQHMTALEVPALAKGAVYERDAAGTYSAVNFARAELPAGESAPAFDPQGVMLSELMPLNRATLADEDGDFSDWIELSNGGSRSVSLEGWALSDSERVLRKWVFPAQTLNPGEYLIVFASGKNRRTPGRELHTGFRLSGKGEIVRLSDPDGRVISQITYDGADADQSLSRDVASGHVTTAAAPSPGAARGGAAKVMENSLGLYINEVCGGGVDGDWVELRNESGMPIDLRDMGLSDDPGKPRRWQFPEGAVIQPGGYLVVAFGSQRSEESLLQPDFTCDLGLSVGEMACLATPDGKIIDRMKLSYAAQGSAGRAEGYDTVRWFAQTTPGAANAGASYAQALREVSFSPAGGVVRGGQVTVTLSTDPGVNIYYTTDGSEPTTRSAVYSGPITLNQTTCLRCITDPADVMLNQPRAATYVFTPHTHRVVCVSGDPGVLLGDNGLLNTGEKDGNTDVFVEIYGPDGEQLIGQGCHLTMTGHNTRTGNSQKSFKLNARRANGDTRFRAALFENRDFDQYKVLSLRCSGQDYKKTHMLDSVLTALMAGTHVLYQETEVCVLYVDGYYWGLYNLREHIDRHSVAQHMGWTDENSVNIVHGTGEKISASAGKSDDYKKLLEWAGKTDLSKAENLQALRENMVVESYLDYVIMQMYACNQDLSNIRAFRSLTEDKRWRFVVYDFDLSFRLNADNYVDDWFGRKAGTITGQDTTLFRALMKNAEVRDYFLRRFGELLATNYASENVVARIEARRDLIREEMARNCERWSWSTQTWEAEVAQIIDYAKVRPGIVIDYVCQAFELSDADRQRYFSEALAKISA